MRGARTQNSDLRQDEIWYQLVARGPSRHSNRQPRIDDTTSCAQPKGKQNHIEEQVEISEKSPL